MSGKEYRQVRYRPPAGAASLLLIRHGESAAAVDGAPWPDWHGHADPDLHPHGRAQAERVADRLADEGVAALYVTPLVRTRRTAEPLAARLDLPLRVEADLREVFVGEWEGPPYLRNLAEGHPLALRMIEEERWDLAPGAEPADEFAARVEAGVRRIATAHADQVVAVFTHGGVIGQILACATGSRPFAFLGADNGSISHLVVAGQRATLRCFNDVAHLTGRFTAQEELPWDDVPPADATHS